MDNMPFVFISYAHLDNDVVMPCIDMMKRNGINLWYDEGIEAGSEWPEFIAEKVVSCNKFVLFISKSYLNSQNCKRELNFAISRKKNILSIFLEDVILSPGMEMQLGTYQAIYRKRFGNVAAFHSSLCKEDFFNTCRLVQTTKTLSEEQPQTDSYPKVPIRNRVIAALLALFLGFLGVHKFYLKQPLQGVLYLLFCWTYIPLVLSLIEGVILLLSSDAKFEKRYKCKAR